MSNTILDSTGKLNINKLNDYQQSLIKATIQKLEYYSLSNLKTLPIRYLRAKPSHNEDTETGLKHEHHNSVFWEYHFLPTVETQMFSPQVMYDDMKQGMNYTATGDLIIMTVDKPLPGDYFNFYVDAHKLLQEKELFKIQDVTFIRTALGLNMYRITYETAQNIGVDSIYVEKSFFYNPEFRQVYSSEYILSYQELVSRKYLETINKYYKQSWSIIYDENLSQEHNLKLNKVLIWLKSKSLTNSTGLPLILINGFKPETIAGPFYTGQDGLNFNREDVWLENPDYEHPHLQPDYDQENPPEWSWLDSRLPNELALTIFELCYWYSPFIFDLGKQDEKHDYLEKTKLINEYYQKRKESLELQKILQERFRGACTEDEKP